MRKILLGALALAALLGWSKYAWQSGFDQGVDVDSCVIASLQNGGKLASSEPACKRAHEYQSNPLWLLRRRGNNGVSDEG